MQKINKKFNVMRSIDKKNINRQLKENKEIEKTD